MGLEKIGAEVTRLELTDDDFTELEEYAGEHFDAVIDINSRLPKLIDEKGRAFLDSIDAPFFNYILDHPLYHHPGLSVKLRDYHSIGVDEYHCAYMKKHYPHLKSVSCIPMGGTKAIGDIPFDEREHDFLFPGTYLLPEILKERCLSLRRDFGNETYGLMNALYDAWDPQKGTMEEAFREIYEGGDEAEILNRLYIVDQMKRNEERKRILTEAASTGYPITILGEGWEETELCDMKNVRLIRSVPMEMSFEIIANSKCVIDPDPFFWCGMHDRVAAALANSCVCITDMSDEFDRDLSEGKNIFYFGRGRRSIAEAMRFVASMKVEKQRETAAAGNMIWEKSYSWDVHIKKLADMM